jgi:hypothetical protein
MITSDVPAEESIFSQTPLQPTGALLMTFPQILLLFFLTLLWGCRLFYLLFIYPILWLLGYRNDR